MGPKQDISVAVTGGGAEGGQVSLGGSRGSRVPRPVGCPRPGAPARSGYLRPWAGQLFPSTPALASRAPRPGSGSEKRGGGDCGGSSPAALRAEGLHGAASAAVWAVGAAAVRRREPRSRGHR